LCDISFHGRNFLVVAERAGWDFITFQPPIILGEREMERSTGEQRSGEKGTAPVALRVISHWKSDATTAHQNVAATFSTLRRRVIKCLLLHTFCRTFSLICITARCVFFLTHKGWRSRRNLSFSAESPPFHNGAFFTWPLPSRRFALQQLIIEVLTKISFHFFILRDAVIYCEVVFLDCCKLASNVALSNTEILRRKNCFIALFF